MWTGVTLALSLLLGARGDGDHHHHHPHGVLDSEAAEDRPVLYYANPEDPSQVYSQQGEHGMTMIDFISLSSNYFSLRHALSKRYCFTENNYLNSDNMKMNGKFYKCWMCYRANYVTFVTFSRFP